MTVTEKTAGETVKVLAPSNLPEGYVMDVTLDGDTFTVTVPPGGAKEGEYFNAIITSPAPAPITSLSASVPTTSPYASAPITSLSASAPPADPGMMAVAAVPIRGDGASITTSKTIVQNPDGTQTVTEETIYPDGRVTKSVTTTAAPIASAVATSLKPPTPPVAGPVAEVPTGAWRRGLFDCCDLCGNGMFWMAWCCPYIAMGQLLQRMKLNLCGQPGDYKNTCMIWTIIWAACFALYWVILAATNGYGIAVYFALMIFSVVALTNVRFLMRKKWNLPADCCDEDGCLGDCCCVFWCECCATIQMLRHTHDENVDRYNCASPTGLNEGAAEVV